MELNIAALLLQGIPEMIALAALNFAIARTRLRWKIIFWIGVAQGFLVYGIRLLPVPFGVHTIAMTLFFVFCLIRFGNVSFLRGFYSAFLGTAFLILYEFLTHLFFVRIMGLSLDTPGLEDSIIWILMGWPQVILFFLTALLINRLSSRASSHEGRSRGAF
ncbi:MAG: hypothetical protein ACOYU7_08890 [Bacillota bacterium]